jgi:hypothetical protein
MPQESFAAQLLAEFQKISKECTRPSRTLFPEVYVVGQDWVASYGRGNDVVVGYGNTPEEACVAFDKTWLELTVATPVKVENVY